MREFPAYDLQKIMSLPIGEFFLLVDMAADSAKRFGIGGILSAFVDVKKKDKKQNISDLDKLRSLGFKIKHGQ